MKRITTIASLICLLTGQCVAKDDHFIKIERVVLPLSESLQKDGRHRIPPGWRGEPAQSLELRVEPEMPFHVRLEFGQERIELRGVLRKEDPKTPNLRIELDYEARIKNQVEKNQIGLRRLRTTVQVRLDEYQHEAGSISDSGGKEIFASLRWIVRKADQFDNSYVEELSRHEHGKAVKKPFALKISSHGFDERQVEEQEVQLDDLQLLNQISLANQQRYSLVIATEIAKPFQLRARFLKSEVVAEGLLFPAKKLNNLYLAVSVAEIIHSGVKVSNPGEQDVEIKDRTEVKSSHSLELGKPAILGGMITQTNLGNGSKKSERSFNLFKALVTEMPPK